MTANKRATTQVPDELRTERCLLSGGYPIRIQPHSECNADIWPGGHQSGAIGAGLWVMVDDGLSGNTLRGGSSNRDAAMYRLVRTTGARLVRTAE